MLSFFYLLFHLFRVFVCTGSQLWRCPICIENWPFKPLLIRVEILVLFKLYFDFNLIRQRILTGSRLHPAAFYHFFWVNMRSKNKRDLPITLLLKVVRANWANALATQLFKVYFAVWNVVITPLVDWVGNWLQFIFVHCNLLRSCDCWCLDRKRDFLQFLLIVIQTKSRVLFGEDILR